jgi:hypothetical protein
VFDVLFGYLNAVIYDQLKHANQYFVLQVDRG